MQLIQQRTVIDGGNVPFIFTRTPTVGKAVAAILKRPYETRNRAVFVHEGITTQNELIAHAQKLLTFAGDSSEPSPTFKITNVNSAATEIAAWRSFHRSATDLSNWAPPFINLSLWSGRELCYFHNPDNDLLGVGELRGAELDALLCEETGRAATAFGLVGRCSRAQMLDAEIRGYQALEAGKELLCVDD